MDDDIRQELPEYRHPPVIEVVCGLRFRRLDRLLASHLGSFWDKIRLQYPRSEEHPLLPVAVENIEELKLRSIPELPRIWFVSSDNVQLIQVQRSAFYCNWRKQRAEDDYPRYSNVVENFRRNMHTFQAFLEEFDLGNLVPLQYELSYVNHISRGEGWETLADAEAIFPVFALPSKEATGTTATSFHWQTAFCLAEGKGNLVATINTGKRPSDRQPVIRFDLACRGLPKGSNLDSMWDWFDVAHKSIVTHFANLTSLDVQQNVWGRVS